MSEVDCFFELLDQPEYQKYRNLTNDIFQRFVRGQDYKLPTMVEFFLAQQAITTMALEKLLVTMKSQEAKIAQLESLMGYE